VWDDIPKGLKTNKINKVRCIKMWFKHVRCNPDVAPRLTSGGYEDKVDVLTPINILFIGG
jgi:hypothetical protein